MKACSHINFIDLIILSFKHETVLGDEMTFSHNSKE